MTRQTQVAIKAFAPKTMDEDDFHGLYQQYNRRIYNLFANRGYGREESRDLVQETFLAAYHKRSSYRGDSPPAAWLFGIALNLWRRNLRDSKRIKRDAQLISLDGSVGGDENDLPRAFQLTATEPEGQPLEKYLADERIRLLHDALQELPERSRHCAVLHLRGYKYREIADVLQVSLNTVRSQLFDAREKLRHRLRGSFSDLSTLEREG